jgi:DNA-binding CsgD family transcriptional regulator
MAERIPRPAEARTRAWIRLPRHAHEPKLRSLGTYSGVEEAAAPQPASSTQPRESGILTLLAEGLTQKQAAAHLGLHTRTVTNTLGHMRERYRAPTNEALVARAVRLEWISLAISCAEAESFQRESGEGRSPGHYRALYQQTLCRAANV